MPDDVMGWGMVISLVVFSFWRLSLVCVGVACLCFIESRDWICRKALEFANER
jgi:hypothetical protein